MNASYIYIMHICSMIKYMHRAYMYHVYIRVKVCPCIPNLRIMNTCIVHTCVRIKDNICMHHTCMYQDQGSCIIQYVHHGHMYQDQEYMNHTSGSRIVYTIHASGSRIKNHRYIHASTRAKNRGSYLYASYPHGSGSMIMHVCMNTCIICRYNNQNQGYMHHGYMHHGYMHRGYMHHVYMHHGYMHHGYIYHGYMHHGYMHHGYMHHGYMNHGQCINHGYMHH